MDKNELKARALLERIAQVVTDYEERIADFRADATMQLTTLSNQIDKLTKELDELRLGKVADDEVVAVLENQSKDEAN